MALVSLDDVKEKKELPAAGDILAFQDSAGRVRFGRVRLREVRCGKENCHKCPHKIYAYAQYRVGKRVFDKYIGVAR